MYPETERNRTAVPAYRLISALLDDPDLAPNDRFADVLAGLAGSRLSRYNGVITELAYLAAEFLKRHYGLDVAQGSVLTSIALRLDAEERKMRQAFESIIPPGRNLN